jgi:hypothetical protein
MKCFFTWELKWPTDVIVLMLLGRSSQTFGAQWTKVLAIKEVRRVTTWGSRQCRVLCECILELTENTVFNDSASISLVYKNINLLSCMLNISANLGTRKYLNRGVLDALYLALHTFRIALFCKISSLCNLNWYAELQIIAPYDK